MRGIGLANTIERAAGGFEAAEIRFDRSGTVTLVSGSITQGQGHETVYKQLLCDRLGIHPDQVHYVQGDTEIRFEDGLFSAPRSNRTVTVGEIAKESLNPQNLPEGMDLGLIAGATFACKAQNFPNGCHICELEIDEETGEVELLRYSVVDDVGTVMNPLLLEGQIRGGIAQGVGQVLNGGHPFRPRPGPTPDRIVHGLRDAAGRHSFDDRLRRQPGADPD